MSLDFWFRITLENVNRISASWIKIPFTFPKCCLVWRTFIIVICLLKGKWHCQLSVTGWLHRPRKPKAGWLNCMMLKAVINDLKLIENPSGSWKKTFKGSIFKYLKWCWGSLECSVFYGISRITNVSRIIIYLAALAVRNSKGVENRNDTLMPAGEKKLTRADGGSLLLPLPLGSRHILNRSKYSGKPEPFDNTIGDKQLKCVRRGSCLER